MGFEWKDREALQRSLADRRYLLDDLHAAGEITKGVYDREVGILNHRRAEAGLSDDKPELQVIG